MFDSALIHPTEMQLSILFNYIGETIAGSSNKDSKGANALGPPMHWGLQAQFAPKVKGPHRQASGQGSKYVRPGKAMPFSRCAVTL